ncbi:hypothetical protein [Cohnella nanjingensis]|uniref:Uncharacterized protein n=1 Tax=Cohnella nanjingensis TaxID=1387779 RepID=A0A7X0RRK4_9BACL|nr:hypothetical protein [Cohnella nanjingensis]MBB6670984.1 hypothetical protein [Cohnella nanjingensis]
MSDLMKGVIKGVKKEIQYFADVALKSGAIHVGKELANVTRDVNQPSELNLETISNALKSGIMATGQELMTTGLERVKATSPQDQKKSKASKKST